MDTQHFDRYLEELTLWLGKHGFTPDQLPVTRLSARAAFYRDDKPLHGLNLLLGSKRKRQYCAIAYAPHALSADDFVAFSREVYSSASRRYFFGGVQVYPVLVTETVTPELQAFVRQRYCRTHRNAEENPVLIVLSTSDLLFYEAGSSLRWELPERRVEVNELFHPSHLDAPPSTPARETDNVAPVTPTPSPTLSVSVGTTPRILKKQAALSQEPGPPAASNGSEDLSPKIHLEPCPERRATTQERVEIALGARFKMRRSRTIEHTINIDWRSVKNVEGQAGLRTILHAAIRGELERSQGQSYHQSETIEHEIELDGSRSHIYELCWSDIWQKGTLELREGNTTQLIPFECRIGTELKVCAASPSEGMVSSPG